MKAASELSVPGQIGTIGDCDVTREHGLQEPCGSSSEHWSPSLSRDVSLRRVCNIV